MNNIPKNIKYAGGVFVVSSVLLLSACFSSSSNKDNTTTTEELAPLAVTSTAPADQDTNVGTNTKVVAVLNNELKPGTVDGTSFTLQGASEPAIVGTVSYNADTLTASLDPNSNLTASTQYTAVITTDVEDVADDSLLENFSWAFTTGGGEDSTAPTVASVNPSDGAVNVLRNVKITVIFDEAIDPDTVTESSFSLNDDTAGAAVPGSLRYVNPSTLVFSSSANLVATSDHTLTLSAAITDIADNPLAPTTVSFTTGTEVSSSPAAVNLGTAGNYVILAKTGISTTGTTQITGDIAVSPESQTALTGFSETLNANGTFATSSLVTGKLFASDMASPTPTTLTTAVSDMETAYTDAAGRSNPHFSELGAGEIGGLTLDPGLYKWGTGVLATSDVTLSGSASDVWVFQIGQDLKLQDGKAIVLSGGALPENVFWQVAGEVTLQAGTTFNGIVLGQTAVVVKSGAVINGRAMAQTATTLIANEVNEPGS
ncbi:MAG: ice-binding family protein [Pseudomonadota bacterium]